MLPPKQVKVDLHRFQQKIGRLSLFRKNISPFLHAEPFGNDNAPNEGTVIFFAKFGDISPSLQQ